MRHLPTMKYVVSVIQSNLIIYSIYALPRDEIYRRDILETAVKNGLNLHFVNENLVIQNEADMEHVEDVLKFARY